MSAYGKLVARAPRAFASTLAAVDFLAEPPLELTLVGSAGDPTYQALRGAVGACYLPNRVLSHLDPSAPERESQGLPLLAGKQALKGAALFVCRASVCDAPISEPELVAAALARRAQ